MLNRKPNLDQLMELGLLSDETPTKVTALYREATAKLELSALDYLSINDLLDLLPGPDPAIHALLICMFEVLHEGSLCLALNQEELTTRLSRFAGDQAEDLGEQIASLPDHLPSHQDLITADAQAFHPLVIRQRGPLHYLYWQRFLVQETMLEQQLHRLFNRPKPDLTAADAHRILRAVIHERPLQLNNQPLTLNPEQKLALALGLLQNATIISGGPGTGKTSIIISLLRCLLRSGLAPEDIRLAAPTGRAAQRLTDTLVSGLQMLEPPIEPLDQALLTLKGHTLHHLLRYSPSTHSFAYGPGRPLPIKALIVDEVSMVDVSIMAQLLQAVPDSCRVLLLGDKDQLPSVEAGAVLAELIPLHANASFSTKMAQDLTQAEPGLTVPRTTADAGILTDRIVILRQTYRSSKTILEVAEKINAGDEQASDQLPTIDTPDQVRHALLADGCRFIDTPGDQPRRWQMLLDNWSTLYQQPHEEQATAFGELVQSVRDHDLESGAIDRDSPSGQLLDTLLIHVERYRVLTVVREGPRGCETINRYLSNRLRPLLDPAAQGPHFAGLPVMITRNNYQRDLYNGDVGLALRDKHGNLRVVFRRLDQFLSLPIELLPAHEAAFAITVHKSQGSEYDRLLLVLPNQAGHRLLTREILYTGLTRARSTALIAGTPSVLREAIRRRIHRQSGLSIWPQPAAPHAPAPPTPRPDQQTPTQLDLPLFDD